MHPVIEELKRRMDGARITIRELAQRSGKCEATIGGLFSGRIDNTSLETVDAIGRALSAIEEEILRAIGGGYRTVEEAEKFGERGTRNAERGIRSDESDESDPASPKATPGQAPGQAEGTEEKTRKPERGTRNKRVGWTRMRKREVA